jgi:negative regulator of replication initiation
MSLETELEAIREGIRAGRFSNEASVSQGIILRLLNALEWPLYDTQIVSPEYSLSGRRVDFALCHPPNKPIAFIEVKQLGQSDGAERQLFEYAFHDGIPLAILTDGREWNFFLPGEQGDYGERRLYKLDILDRDLLECTTRLKRYLRYSDIVSGAAIQAAKSDYQNVSRNRQMIATLPRAWKQIVEEEDEMLLEIIADRVEVLCGYKPDPDLVSAFLKESNLLNRGGLPLNPMVPSGENEPKAASRATKTISPSACGIVKNLGQIGLTVQNRFYRAKNAIDVLRQLFEILSDIDPTFPERFTSLPLHGRTRRYLAIDPNELYPGRPDLCRDCSVKLKSGYWLGTNHSRQSIKHIIDLVRDVAHHEKGKDFSFNLGGSDV